MRFTPQEIKILQKASTDFVYFVNEVFSLSERNFIKGEHVDNSARFLSQNKKTLRVSARHHFKSFSLYAYFMWKLMFQGAVSNLEVHYFSFNAELAGYHIKKIKQAIAANPFFKDIIDLKPTAESVIKYTWDRKHTTSIEPHGLIQFKRGIHCDITFVDDPFQDPENELNLSIIYKINEIFKSNILDMPKEPDGELHIVGTAQTKEDFFFDELVTKRFKVKILPAISKDEITGKDKALWPEWMDLEELYLKREERTERIFSREYMCTPVYSTIAFFNRETLEKKIINRNLIMMKKRIKYRPQGRVYAGFDIGKKAHPSHLAVFEDRENKLIMIHHKFMDGWPYASGKQFFEPHPTQLEYLKLCIQNFNIVELFYDNTRAEFEASADQGILPPQMIPIILTPKVRYMMATGFDKLVEREQLEIPNDERLIDQICSVTNDLHAIQSAKGHGDAFWSVALALLGVKDLIGYMDDTVGEIRRNVESGKKSLFSSDTKIPRGF